ncbi:MAG: hypothetical protein ACFFD3_14540 [Candidatus Thorarchaeota archaeon]
MSQVYNYSKELVPLTHDPRERAADIRVRRGVTGAKIRKPRIRPGAKCGSNVKVPLSYLLASRIKLWLMRSD